MDIRSWEKQAAPGQRYQYGPNEARFATMMQDEGKVMLVQRLHITDQGHRYYSKYAVKVSARTREWADRVSKTVVANKWHKVEL